MFPRRRVVVFYVLATIGCSSSASETRSDARPSVEVGDVVDAIEFEADADALDTAVTEAADASYADVDFGECAADASTIGPADLWVNPCGCTAANIGAIFRGVRVYCQPPGTTSGTQFYQCDELANRFLRDALLHPDLDNVVIDSAFEICSKAEHMTAYSAWGPKFRANAGKKPQSGDLLVWNGAPGHVAVVVDASAPTSIVVVQQNGGPSVGVVGWDDATSFFGDLGAQTAECWVHAEDAPPAPAPSGDACGCFDGDGDYCGLSLVDHAWWYGCSVDGALDYDTLYSCVGGVITPKSTCDRGCVTDVLVPATGHCAP